MLRSGEVFADYVIERELGRGGMGTVYLARHPRLPRLTVLKVLNPELFSDAESRARFEREAELVARLDHPNIVSVYDRGAVGERLWIAMQYVEGADASTISGPMAPERAVRIISEVAEGLDHAHSKGVLHRDVKPANILLEHPHEGRPERVLLSDFGIARLRDDGGHLTSTGTFTATLAYASPEQLSGATLDARVDQYSLACTLFRLLTGAPPFTAEHPAVVMQGHLYDAAPIASMLRPDLPAALDSVLTRAMAKRPENRFASCTDFAAAARRALGDWTAPTVPTAPTMAATAHTQLAQPTPPALAPGKRSRTRVRAGIAAGVAAVLLAGAGAYAAYGNSDSPVQTSAGDHAAIWNAFPKMVPVDTKRKEGYHGSSCKSSKDGKGVDRDDDGLDFGRWTAGWECESSSDYKDPTFRIYAYQSAADVQAVVALLDPKTRFTAENNGRSYTLYRVKSYWGEAIVAVFLDSRDRAPFLMYARPKYTSEPLDVAAWWKSTTLD
ncbi:serine/threonine-protein kinase [Nocardia sp. NPDC051832]|uniref:serine/threonine-protein kinase n=1 Tax=Nocardia sp. NPDC051832 TaxID=3155673 RepID=UPI003430F02B